MSILVGNSRRHVLSCRGSFRTTSDLCTVTCGLGITHLLFLLNIAITSLREEGAGRFDGRPLVCPHF